MSEPWLEEEEHPDHDHSHLFDNRAIGSGAELCDASSTAIEHGASKDEADAVCEQDWVSLELLCRDENIVRVIVDTLRFIERARE